MKFFSRVLIGLASLSIASTMNAMDCVEFSIEDHGDHLEAVCVGTEQAGTTKSTNTISRSSTQSQVETYTTRQAPPTTPSVNSCKFLQANHNDVGRNPNVEVEVGCELTGQPSQYVEFLLAGLSSTGERLVSTNYHGYFNDEGIANLKKTFTVEYGKFINTRKWEPDRSNKGVLVAKEYKFNDNELLLRTTQIKEEITERESQSSGSWSNPDYIKMKRGVSFNHGLHQKQFDCSKCHNNSYGGKISGFGKDWAHMTCKGCHANGNRGPTSCKNCHKQ